MIQTFHKSIFDIDRKESDAVLLFHVCNDIGAWGGGFTAELGMKDPKITSFYRSFKKLTLGECKYFHSSKLNMMIGNMIAQKGLFHPDNNPQPFQFEVFKTILLRDLPQFDTPDRRIVLPFGIGCGLGKGNWYEVSTFLDSLPQKIELYKI